MKHLLLSLSIALVCTQPLADLTLERTAQLANLLVQDCGSCHGLRFRGGLGPALLPDNLGGKPRQFLISTILDGRPGTAMPAWRALLNDEEAAWLVDRLLMGVHPGAGS